MGRIKLYSSLLSYFFVNDSKKLLIRLIYQKFEIKTYRVVALEGSEVSKSGERCRISHPLDSLPVCDEPDLWHFVNSVKECNKAFFVMGLSKPGCVVE